MNPPRFAEKSELVRYIDEDKRMGGNRPAVSAYLPDAPSDNQKKSYFSVNSLEIETLRVIAAYHQIRSQGGEGRVALCSHKVVDYNNAAKKSGISISYDKIEGRWTFKDFDDCIEPAYKHHPRTDVLKSLSHCGIEYMRALATQHDIAKFARRMTNKRFHLV